MSYVNKKTITDKEKYKGDNRYMINIPTTVIENIEVSEAELYYASLSKTKSY